MAGETPTHQKSVYSGSSTALNQGLAHHYPRAINKVLLALVWTLPPWRSPAETGSALPWGPWPRPGQLRTSAHQRFVPAVFLGLLRFHVRFHVGPSGIAPPAVEWWVIPH